MFRFFRTPKPGGNNVEIPIGCLAFLAAVLVIEVGVIIVHVLSYPVRNP